MNWTLVVNCGRAQAVAREIFTRSVLLAMAPLLAVLFAMPAAAGAHPLLSHYEVEPHFDGVETTTFYIRSGDGTRLAVALHRPTVNGVVAQEPLPVVVQQVRGQAGNDPQQAAMHYFTARGYVWLTQSRRGTGASFGSQTGFVTEFDAQDAKAAIEWAAAQPFSNGRVVAYGCSNEGLWQYRVAALAPRGLVAISPQCATAAVFDLALSPNGIPAIGLTPTPFDGTCEASQRAARRENEPLPDPVDSDPDGTMLDAALVAQECPAPFLGQYWLNMARDGYNAFAGNRPGVDDAPIRDAQAIEASGIKVLEIGGWFDAGVAGQFETQRLWGGRTVMLPRRHGNREMDGRYPNDVFDVHAEVLRWFDHYAKDVNNGANWPGVTYYTINARPGSEWRYAPTWRAASFPQRTFYLGAEGLTADGPHAGGQPIVYGQREVAWFDGRYASLARQWDGDMSQADSRSIVHDSAPLATAMEMTGTPSASLWISADQPDVNVYAVIEDVAPDGRSTYVTDGRLRASWRQLSAPPWGGSDWNWHRGYTDDIAPLTPGEPAELVFDLYPISYVFAEGHRIRMSIITQTPNAYEAPPLANGQPITLTLYRDDDRRSRVHLPLQEAE